MTTIKRKVTTVYAPASQPGFLGKGHVARPVIQLPYTESDPFIMLMDDMLDKQDDAPVGGPHPHAGFETVTLLLQGSMGEAPHEMKAGDFEMMTAGKGVVHTEVISKKEKFRLLQMWLNLPKDQRHAPPRLQQLKSADVPGWSGNGVTLRVYSGSFAGLISPVKNYTPVIIAEILLGANASLTETIPANFSTFFYVLDGNIAAGDDNRRVLQDEVAWLDRSAEPVDSELSIRADEQGARLVLYSGLPQRHEIVAHGPFIADSTEEIRELYADFRYGRMKHISEVVAAQEGAHIA